MKRLTEKFGTEKFFCPRFFCQSFWVACGWAALGHPSLAGLAQTNPPVYPRINLATSYEVDTNWPQRRPDIPWGQMPGVAVDSKDNIWVYTRTNPTVQVYATDGRYLFGWRNESTNSIPHFIRIDRQGNVWMADVGLHIVTKSSPEGKLLLTLGVQGQPGDDAAHFNKPTDIAIAPNGDLFVADGYGNNRIVHFDRRGKFVKAWGKLGTAPGEFSIPHSIACDSKGRLYVADRNNVRVQVFDQRGKLLDVWQKVLVPWGIWISAKDEIWVCGSSPMPWTDDPKYPNAPLGCPPKDQLFAKFDASGRIRELWTVPKGQDGHEQPGELNWLHDMAFDSKGNLYLGDIIGKRVQRFVPRR
jgi:sugar lactone lactonase YvrE